MSEFWSIYRHGFARVAACTITTSLGQPARNAAAVLAHAGECAADGVAVAVFPELTLSGYSIEDLVLQDALLDAVEAALGTIVAASADLLPVLVVGAPLRHAQPRVQHRRRHPPRPGARRRAEVVPADVPRVLRAPPARARRRRARHDPHRSASTVPFGPDLLFAADDVAGLVVHVEICEDMWVPIPPSAEAALAGATVLANLCGSPITVGRAEDRTLLCRSASARCLAAYVYAAAGEGESTTDLAWDGQTMIYENGALLAESRALPRRPAAQRRRHRPRPAARRAGPDGHVRRQPPPPRGAPRRVPRDRASGSTRRSTDIGLRRTRRALPVRPRRRSAASPRTATRPTTSRSPGWSSGCGPSATRSS